MPELSTLLRQRLRATEDRSGQHPDPDTLTAYIEQSLPVPERDTLVRHLSLCSQCREVVALTMPETMAEALPGAVAPAGVSSAAPRRRWFLSPAFGLGGSIAVMVLGVALILNLPANRQQQGGPALAKQQQQARLSQPPAAVPTAPLIPSSASDAKQATQPQPTSANAEQPVTAATTPVAKPSEPAMTAGALRPLAPVSGPHERPQAAGKTPTPIYTAGLQTQDYINKTFIANSYQPQASSAVYRELPQAPMPMQSNLAFAPPAVVAGNSFQNGSFEITTKNGGGNRGVITFFPAPQESRGSTLLGKIVDLGKRPLSRRLGPPIPSNSLGASAMFKPGAAGAQPGEAIAAAKTSDQSQGGALSQSHAFTSNALASIPRNSGSGAPQYQWKIVQGKLLKSSDLSHWSEENPAGENLEYSVVSPNGSDIWAGGSEAALLHSRDAGATWERVTLGASATGTINSIEVAGQNVLVKSSSGQSWASQDGGKSWSLQD